MLSMMDGRKHRVLPIVITLDGNNVFHQTESLSPITTPPCLMKTSESFFMDRKLGYQTNEGSSNINSLLESLDKVYWVPLTNYKLEQRLEDLLMT